MYQPINTPQQTVNLSLKAIIEQKPWLVLLLLFFATYCVNLLLPRDLWVQDEMRYGEVVREMLSTGNWLVPHLNGAPYPDKPALYFWIICIVSSLLGQGEFAFRIVSTLATLHRHFSSRQFYRWASMWFLGQRAVWLFFTHTHRRTNCAHGYVAHCHDYF